MIITGVNELSPFYTPRNEVGGGSGVVGGGGVRVGGRSVYWIHLVCRSVRRSANGRVFEALLKFAFDFNSKRPYVTDWNSVCMCVSFYRTHDLELWCSKVKFWNSHISGMPNDLQFLGYS